MADTLLLLPLAAYTAPMAPYVFDTTQVVYGALDITVASFQGGTAPVVTFILERQGTDGLWYNILSTGSNVTSPGPISIDISPNLNGVLSAPLSSAYQHNVFSNAARLRWTFGGTAAPTSVTFSVSMMGRK